MEVQDAATQEVAAPQSTSLQAEAVEEVREGEAQEAQEAKEAKEAKEPEGVGDVAQTEGAAASSAKSGRLAIDGALSTRLRGRSTDGAHDLDAYAVLDLDVGDASRDRFSGRFLGRLSADLDGRSDDDSQGHYGSLQDIYDDPVHADLYEASLQVRHVFDAPVNARLGRQVDSETPQVAHFDGLRLSSEPRGDSQLSLGLWGGVPVRIYDATSIADAIGGAWAEGRPWKRARARFDWMHVDQSAFPEDLGNDLFAVSLDQQIDQRLGLDVSYSRLEERDRDVRVRADWSDGRGDLLVQASYYRLLSTQRDLVWEFDPFTATLQEYRPYGQAHLLISKGLTKRLRLDLGGDVRRLSDDSDEGLWNHEWERGYATFVASDLFLEGLDLSLSGDSWSSDDRDVQTWGVDVTRQVPQGWRASLGSFYTLYKFDALSGSERDDVRVWYLKLRRKLNDALRLDLGYEFQDDDPDDYHVFEVGATWHF